ncbi:MAG: galactosyldiacylglycerol synthase [Chloroflexota bacterium]
MTRITNTETGADLGELGEGELQFLIDTLEEESLEDQDYYIDRRSLEYLKARGADPKLMKLLITAMGDNDSVTIRWD